MAVHHRPDRALERRIGELVPQLADPDIEVARGAKRALWRVVRHASRPGAESERKVIEAALIAQLEAERPAAVYREATWMLSEIGTDASVQCLSALLANPTAREDARMSLERIPGAKSLAALKTALETVPDDFKINIAQSLRARNVDVPGLPCEKLKPVKQFRPGAASS